MILFFDAGPLATKEGGVDFDRIREIVMSRLPELPRLRTKLRRVPGDGHPVWVDDQEFNLDYPLRQSSLPRPGNQDPLCRTASRIAASRLDRSRPLWDCWVIEGLEGGRFSPRSSPSPVELFRQEVIVCRAFARASGNGVFPCGGTNSGLNG